MSAGMGPDGANDDKLPRTTGYKLWPTNQPEASGQPPHTLAKPTFPPLTWVRAFAPGYEERTDPCLQPRDTVLRRHPEFPFSVARILARLDSRWATQ